MRRNVHYNMRRNFVKIIRAVTRLYEDVYRSVSCLRCWFNELFNSPSLLGINLTRLASHKLTPSRPLSVRTSIIRALSFYIFSLYSLFLYTVVIRRQFQGVYKLSQ
jgi:hypothetical protein